MIADMLGNKKPNPVVTELFIRSKKNYTFLLFLSHALLFKIKCRLNSGHYFAVKISNKSELQKIASDNPSHFKKKFLERI